VGLIEAQRDGVQNGGQRQREGRAEPYMRPPHMRAVAAYTVSDRRRLARIDTAIAGGAARTNAALPAIEGPRKSGRAPGAVVFKDISNMRF
jgi:hypothetical protein